MENKPIFVLLVGGKSERMGLPKGILLYQETFWILEQLNRISNSNLTTVFIGLGFHFEKYFEKIPWLKEAQADFVMYKNLKIRVVVNSSPERGSFSTLLSVLYQIPKSNSVLIHPIDVPILKATELQKIIETQNNIVLPSYQGKNGHPIMVSPLFWNPLLDLNVNDEDARLDFQIKNSKPSERSSITVKDFSVILNLNTPKEWMDFVKGQ